LLNAIFQQPFDRFDEICMAMHTSRFCAIGDEKFENLKIQGGGRRPSRKSKIVISPKLVG